jgi:hypothetical protein
MKNLNDDERFDALMKTLISRSAIDDETLNDLADSPAIWWQVQSRIAADKAAVSPWPPIAKFWRVLAFGIPAAAAVIVLAFVFTSHRSVETENRASGQSAAAPAVSEQTPLAAGSVTSDSLKPEPAAIVLHKSVRKTAPVRSAAMPAGPKPATAKPIGAAVAKKTEFKTDFIALTYARDAESGQIVRVKVPSSMMVTLGLVSTVEKPSNLVDAEVIVGDDGLTRAIRFIR